MNFVFFVMAFIVVLSSPAFAAHPLITDDTGTQGKGNIQLEFIASFGNDEKDGLRKKHLELPTIPVFSYGFSDTTDVVLGVPYVREKTEGEGNTNSINGISDVSIEMKSRFYAKNGWSLAVKPGIRMPSGNEQKARKRKNFL